jgi:hypothetical protein
MALMPLQYKWRTQKLKPLVTHNPPIYMQINDSIFILCTKAMAQLSQKEKRCYLE